MRTGNPSITTGQRPPVSQPSPVLGDYFFCDEGGSGGGSGRGTGGQLFLNSVESDMLFGQATHPQFDMFLPFPHQIGIVGGFRRRQF